MDTATISPKDRALSAIRALPDDAMFEDAMETLYDLIRIQEGVSRIDTDTFVPQEEARRRFGEKWRA
ncbi:MAG: hypothetical protein AAFX41_06045 [Bacteroidota bacterium]